MLAGLGRLASGQLLDLHQPPVVTVIQVVMLADDRRAWVLGSDGEWRKVEALIDQPAGTDTFEQMMAITLESVAAAV